MSWFRKLIDAVTGRGRGARAAAEAADAAPAAPMVAVHRPQRVPVETAPVVARQGSVPDTTSDTAGDTRAISAGFASANPTAAKLRKQIAEAFTPSRPVTDAKRFAGRGEIIDTVIGAIENQRLHVVLYGDRGIGKTSLMQVIGALARQAKYVVARTSCSEESDFSDVFRRLLAEVPLRYHGGMSPSTQRLATADSFATLLPEGPLAAAVVSDLLQQVEGASVILMIDEFDRASSEEFKRATAEVIKNLSDRGVPVMLLIAGVASNLTELISSLPSIRRNVIGIPVRRMANEEVSELIARGGRAAGVEFEADAVEEVISAANGSPYLASLLAHHAALLAAQAATTHVTFANVTDAIMKACRELGLRLSTESHYRLNHLSDLGTDVATALASESIAAGGLLPAEGFSRVFEAVEPGERERLAGEVAPLLVPIGDNGSYRFREEGVPHYLWINRAARSEAA